MPNDIQLVDNNKQLDANEVLDILNDESNDDTKVEDKKPEKSEKEDKDDDKDDEEDAEKLELEDDDTDEDAEEKKLELEDDEESDEEYSSVPSRKQILKDYPDLYKKYPAIEKCLYREQQYAEVFPTVKDAKAAVTELTNYKQLDNELSSGNIEGLFSLLKKNVPDGYGKITDGLLTTLHKVDKEAYTGVLNTVLKSALVQAAMYGKENEDDNLQKAAQIIHQFLYQTPKITAPTKATRTEDKNEDKTSEREQKFYQQRLNSATTEVSERVMHTFENTIDKYIDPKKVMTPYVRDKAIEDAKKEVTRYIMGDRRFRAHLDRLWKSAAQDDFSESSLSKIRNTILGKGKEGLGAIIGKVRGEALKGYKTRTREAADETDDSPIRRGRPAGSEKPNGKIKDTKDIPKGMSTLDILNSMD